MEGFSESSNKANSYTESVIFDEIIATLDGYNSDTLEFPLSKHIFGDEKCELCEETEDPILSSITNDHNYMISNKNSRITCNVRQNLIEFVKKNSTFGCTNRSSPKVEKLIDKVLGLLTEVSNYDLVIEKIEEVCEPKLELPDKIEPIVELLDISENQLVKIEPQEKIVADIKPDLSVLNKIEDKAAEVDLKVESEENPSLEQNNDPVPITDEPDNSIVSKEEDTCETSSTKSVDKSSDSSSPACQEIEKCVGDKDDLKSSEEEVKSVTEEEKFPEENKEELKSSTSNSEESQPAEPTSKNAENNSTESISETPSVVKELLKFAEKLKEDCVNFPSKENDFNLEAFLASKFSEYKSIISSVLYADSSMQTEKVISKKKLRKINAQDKCRLLESSNDSDSSSSSYDESRLESESKSRTPFFSERPSLDSKKSSNINSDDDFDSICSFSKNQNNQISPSSDIEKDIDKSAQDTSNKESDKQDQIIHGNDKSRGKGTNESDKENRSSSVSPESCTSKHDEKMDDDIQDKEIERLLNLKGLADPPKNIPLTNNLKSQKTKNKFSSKTDSLYAVMQEIDKNSLSDDSLNDESEQILTEKQFLVKCNENLKQQLLNSASSESDNFNSDVELDSVNKSNEHSGDEDENRLSYVDKFLETLVDEDNNSPVSNGVLKESSSTKKPITTSPSINSNDTIEISPTTKSTTLGFTKNDNTQKSFESVLSSDKRPKSGKIHEDFIDLSAESCDSDVEEHSVEAKEKSQRIKPMLRQDQLESETIYAQKKEADRLRRLEKRNTFLTKMLKCQSEDVNEKDLILDYATATKKFIKVHPEIVKHLKPHQRDGLKFMYDSCYGCVDSVKESSGSGCILAHCMGLGKTLQIIALLHTVTTYKELKTSKILVLCPKSTIMNWADEIQRWLGPLELKNFQIFNFSDTADIYEKINVMRQWSASSMKAGCLIMGYEAFRSLVFYNSNKSRAKNMRVEDIRININKYLLKPGADLVVCDEGHIIKNRRSGISLAAAEIVTPKRIILTGTPIQNNLKEYYSMVNFIKPLILGTEKEFANLYANPIKNGQHKDSSKRDIKVMKQRSFVLHKKLSKFVQRKEAELLQSFLPQKFEYVLFIPMTDVQNNLYEYVLEAISKREDSRGRGLITDYTCLRKIWTHPKVLEDAWKNAIAARNKREPKKQTNNIAHSDDDQPDDIYDNQTGVISVQCDWWRSLVTDTDLESILPSNKLKTMFEIIRMSEENGEKCLIFSAFVAVLNVVEYFFNKINDKQRNFFVFDLPEKTTGRWINGQDYYRLDGKTNKTLRHEMVKRFNDPKNKRARVFLISAKAGGQGINLIGANRVIILDTSWNPANDQQNIFRIFRLGQKKNCYIYRLIAMGTMEEKVYSRSVTKQAMSFRVVDEQQIDRHYNMAELAELYTLTKPCYKERPVPVFPQDQILANLLLNFPDLVYKYHEHDSLLENKVEQELSEQEKADAWVAYERDLQMNSEPRDVMEAYHGYPLFGQGNYPMYNIGDFEAKNLMPGNTDMNAMDIANRNALASSLLPNYIANRNSYLDILNMYKNFSSSLMNDKSGRNSRYNSNYPMSLAPMMMNNALASNESHLSALTNPFYQLQSLANASSGYSNTPLNPNGMLPNPNLPSSNLNNSERYEQNKNMLSAEDSFASSMRNYPMSPFIKDLTSRSFQSKNHLQSSPSGPSSSPISHSPNRQIPQNIFSTDIGKDGIPRSIISKKRARGATKSTLPNNGPPTESTAKSRSTDSLLRSPSPRQNLVLPDAPGKIFDQPSLQMPVNMGIVYPQSIPLPPLSPVSETNEGSCIMKSGSSMQIIPTHSPLTENVRKKFDNISPNISLTAVRSLPKSMQSEQLQPTSSSSHLETTPSNTRKRRSSLSTSFQEKMYSSGNKKPNTGTTGEQPTYPPKVSKY